MSRLKKLPSPAKGSVRLWNLHVNSHHSLDQLSDLLRSKLKRDQELQVEDGGKRYTYPFDRPYLRQAIKDGTYKLKPGEVQATYLEWFQKQSVVTVTDLQTGQKEHRLAPKRGNVAYANRVQRRVNELLLGLKGLRFDSENIRSRGSVSKRTCQFLITPTYDPSQVSEQEAWSQLSNDLAKFKVQLARELGHDQQYIDKLGRIRTKRVPASIRTITIKEGQEGGYPAPHILIIIDRPISVFRHINKKGQHTWRVQSERLLQSIKTSWNHGFTDVQGVVSDPNTKTKSSSGAVTYMTKYLTKSLRLDSKKDLEQNQTAINTLAWTKALGQRPFHISQQFKNLLNPRRLDTNLPQSQQRTSSMRRYESSTPIEKGNYISTIMELESKWASGPPPGVYPGGP